MKICRIINGMSILTAVFTPEVGQDIPFVIADCVKSKKSITAFVEFYDNHMFSIENKQLFEEALAQKSLQYRSITDYEEKQAWYSRRRCPYSPLKTGCRNEERDIEKMILDYIKEYLNFACSAHINKQDRSKVKNDELEDFIDMLISKGNPSTKIITKALGNEKAQMFYRNVVFDYR